MKVKARWKLTNLKTQRSHNAFLFLPVLTSHHSPKLACQSMMLKDIAHITGRHRRNLMKLHYKTCWDKHTVFAAPPNFFYAPVATWWSGEQISTRTCLWETSPILPDRFGGPQCVAIPRCASVRAGQKHWRRDKRFNKLVTTLINAHTHLFPCCLHVLNVNHHPSSSVCQSDVHRTL